MSDAPSWNGRALPNRLKNSSDNWFFSPLVAASASQKDTSTIVIVVAPMGRGRYCASFGDRVLTESSRQPFCDSARILVADGHDPGTALEMHRVGDDAFALRAALGVAARLAVRENDHHGPRFIRWEAHPLWWTGQAVAVAQESHAGAPHDGGAP